MQQQVDEAKTGANVKLFNQYLQLLYEKYPDFSSMNGGYQKGGYQKGGFTRETNILLFNKIIEDLKNGLKGDKTSKYDEQFIKTQFNEFLNKGYLHRIVIFLSKIPNNIKDNEDNFTDEIFNTMYFKPMPNYVKPHISKYS